MLEKDGPVKVESKIPKEKLRLLHWCYYGWHYGMTTKEIMEKYGLKQSNAQVTRKRGWFVKNYSRPQVKVDPSKFNVDICYNIARKVFKTTFNQWDMEVILILFGKLVFVSFSNIILN